MGGLLQEEVRLLTDGQLADKEGNAHRGHDSGAWCLVSADLVMFGTEMSTGAL